MIASHSAIARLGIQAASPLAIVVGLYLLLAGHNNPGGGFAAGLVFGAVITLRTVAGLQQPLHATRIIAIGVVVVSTVAVVPILSGDVLLDQHLLSIDIPLLGRIKTGGALPFDIGVTTIVVGLVIALLDGLSAASLTEEPTPQRSS